MITSFEDVCLWTYVLIDDYWHQIAPHDHRPGPTPACSDAELVTLAIVGEGKGWHEESVLRSEWARHRDLFPQQPSRTRCNRRRQLQGASNTLRRLVLASVDGAADRQWVRDRLPIAVLPFPLAPHGARAYWRSYDARYGKVPAQALTIFGYKLYLLVTGNGVIRDFALVPANVLALQAGIALLEEHTDLVVLGDKAFISAPLQARLRAENRLILRTLPRRNQREQVPPAVARALNAVRQIVKVCRTPSRRWRGLGPGINPSCGQR
jgi:hypothetical protein